MGEEGMEADTTRRDDLNEWVYRDVIWKSTEVRTPNNGGYETNWPSSVARLDSQL